MKNRLTKSFRLPHRAISSNVSHPAYGVPRAPIRPARTLSPLSLLDQTLAILLLFTVMRIVSGPTANLSYLAIAAYALAGRRQAAEALLLSFLFTQLNTDIFPTASYADIGRYLVVLAAFVSVFGRKRLQIRIDGPFKATLLFGCFALVHSFVFSVMPLVSVLKVSIWLCAMMTTLVAWNGLGAVTHERLAARVFLILAMTVIVSVAASILPTAYLPRTSFLRGIFGHSQALGSVAVIVAVWALVEACGHRRPPWWLLCVAAIAAFAVLGSATRTALVTFAAVIAIVPILAFFKVGRLSPSAFVGLASGRLLFLGICLALAVIAKFDTVSTTITSALTKSETGAGTSVDLTALYLQSRGGLIEEMWDNVERDPLFGIGFGVASNPADMVVTTVAGIPIGAVVEKGVTPLAVWEEIGLFGLALFLVWSAVLIVRATHVEAARVSVILAIMFFNVGEASLLSAGGIGLIQIILLGWVASTAREPSVPRRAVRARGL